MALRIAPPSRASREPLLTLRGTNSTCCSFSRRPGPPLGVCSAYIGWKQPAVSAPKKAMAARRAAMRALNHDIHDPLRNHDDLAGGGPGKGGFYRIEGQNGSLNFRIWRISADRAIGAILAVDLDWQRHVVLDQKRGIGLGPGGLGNAPLAPQYLPALFGEVRHHRRNHPHQDIESFANGGGEGRICFQ